MKAILTAGLLILTSSSSSFAALSGYYDSVSKIQTALNDPALANATRQQAIDSINVYGNEIEVKVAICFYKVTLTANTSGRPGATSYIVEQVSGPRCETAGQ